MLFVVILLASVVMFSAHRFLSHDAMLYSAVFAMFLVCLPQDPVFHQNFYCATYDVPVGSNPSGISPRSLARKSLCRHSRCCMLIIIFIRFDRTPACDVGRAGELGTQHTLRWRSVAR